MTLSYTLLAAFELWRARRELQVSVKPALALHLIHFVTYGVRLVIDRGVPFQASKPPCPRRASSIWLVTGALP